MSSFIEWNSGVIRAGETCKSFGDPYTFVCKVTKVGKTAWLTAGCGIFTKEIYEEIKTLLIKEGIEHVSWERIKANKVIHIEKKLQ